ncbi:tetratricopeptide repeat protein [Amycolatopsis anabasis]|uniref:tetratricopeptide repeat protein n=1 Tax=Amycolatopsis anabasis TaxID=1840409 RepID=UPI001FEC9598|nr:tetratricopeptide repeat protein [Amycolatopsis anabasis]
MKDRAAFGARVRELRLASGLSMKDFGDLVHYSKPQISRVERGLARPTTTFAAACDRVFGTGDELARAAAVLAIGVRRAEGEPKFDLPAGPRRLIGRDTEVEAVRRHLKAADGLRTAHACILYGMPGVGKTAIALWVAELMHDEYPDGRVYLDMQGYNLDHSPVGEDEALDRVLRRLGVSGELVPRSTEDRRALLRQKLAGRRVLLILDNVRNAPQVTGLLPPNGRSAMIITSRQALTALDAAEHRKVTALAPRDAVELFHWVARLSPESDERGDPAVVADIARICCELPLALCIVASRFRDNPVRRLEDVAARLADQTARLRELDDGVRSMTAVFDASYTTLSDAQRAMLSLIALHPGPRVDAYAAGSLAGVAPAAAEDLLDGLIRSGMLERHSSNAYRLHDLLRDHLRQPEVGILSESEAMAARRRLFDYCLHSVAAADTRINEHRYQVPLEPPSSAVTVQEFPDANTAKGWMDREVDNFLPIVQEMSERGESGACWRFVYYLRGYFYATKQWELMTACYERALESAGSQDHQVVAIVLNNLGLACAQLGRRDEAMRLYARARDEFVTAKDPYGEMNVVANHSWLAHDNGEYESARELARTAWNFYRGREQYSNAAIALDCIARCELELGLLVEAERNFSRAYEDFVALNFRDGDTAQLLSHLGETEFRLGNLEKAAEYYQQAIQLARSGEAPQEEAVAFEGLSRVATAQRRVVDADAHFAAAIALYEEVGAAENAERLRSERIAQSRETEMTSDSEGQPRASTKAVAGQSVRVLAVNDEWTSRNGGLSTLNRELCKALAAQGIEVYCSTPYASEDERRDAESVGVHLVHPPPALGAPESALSRLPGLPSGVVPDFVIGHGRKTGEAALWLVEDHFRDAKLLHFFHVISDRVEFEKEHGLGSDPMAAAEQRIQDELVIARRADLAIGVGPALYHYLRDRLHGSGAPEPLRFDPGFDMMEPALGPPPPSDTVRILLVGRLSLREARLKGLDIAARALGHVLMQRGPNDPEVELVLRGVEAGSGKALAASIQDWAEVASLRVVPRPYSADTATLSQDLHQAHLVLMPSRTEGFGLVGLEAIATGVPTLVSKQSGLGALLDEERAELSVELSPRVIPVTNNEQVDTLRWGDAISAVLNSPRPAFSAARALRVEMATKRTWAMAAANLVQAMKSLLGGS